MRKQARAQQRIAHIGCGGLASDDALKAHGEDARFRVREAPDWKQHAASLEIEMLRRGMVFEVIDWSGGQEELPF